MARDLYNPYCRFFVETLFRVVTGRQVPGSGKVLLYALGRYEDAIKTLRQQIPASVPLRTLAAGLAQLGRFAEAKEEATRSAPISIASGSR